MTNRTASGASPNWDDVAIIGDDVAIVGASTWGLSHLIGRLATLNEVVAVLAILADLAVTFANAVIRLFYGTDLFWAQDFEIIALTAGAFLGGAAYTRRGTMAFTLVVDQVRPPLSRLLRAIGLWEVVLICITTLYAFPTVLQSDASQRLPALGLTRGWVGIWVGIGFALACIYALERLVSLGWRANLGAVAIVVPVVLVLVAWGRHASGLDHINPLVAVGFVMIIGFLTGVSIPFLLAGAGLAYVATSGIFPLVIAPLSFEGSLNGSTILVAIPFFMMAGILMDVTGMAGRLVAMLQAWCDHWRGGLLQAAIVSVYIFSGISGSKSADIAAVGSALKKPLKERGYKSTEFVAVLAAGGAMGEALPPSIALLVLASITDLSVASLFLAGIVPCAVVAAALMIAVNLRSRRGHIPGGVDNFSLRRALWCIPPALPALVVPAIVIGGIVFGLGTPTEASSFAVVYGLCIAAIAYRSLSPKRLWTLLRDSTLLAGVILLMVATANLMTKVLVISGLPDALTNGLSVSGNRAVFLILSSLCIIVLGFVLEGLPAILISAPLLLPIAAGFGIDPLQYGVILVIATGIGVFSPPFGIGFYTACAIGDAPVHSTFRSSAFYNIFLFVGLGIVIAFPDITLALPHAFGYH